MTDTPIHHGHPINTGVAACSADLHPMYNRFFTLDWGGVTCEACLAKRPTPGNVLRELIDEMIERSRQQAIEMYLRDHPDLTADDLELTTTTSAVDMEKRVSSIDWLIIPKGAFVRIDSHDQLPEPLRSWIPDTGPLDLGIIRDGTLARNDLQVFQESFAGLVRAEPASNAERIPAGTPFIDGHFTSWWSDHTGEHFHVTDEHDVPEHLDGERFWYELALCDNADLCGCIDVDPLIDPAIAYLSGDWGLYDDTILQFDRDNPLHLLIADLMTRAGFVEHGGNIGGSWITPAGTRWLELAKARR